MSEHDADTFSGKCGCGADIAIGTHCPKCTLESLRAEHGQACLCGSCVRARARVRSAV